MPNEPKDRPEPPRRETPRNEPPPERPGADEQTPKQDEHGKRTGDVDYPKR